MNIAPIAAAIAAVLSLAACQKSASPEAPAGADGDTSVATVNGTPISREFFDIYVEGISGKPTSELTPEQREQALDNLVRAQVIAQQAEKDGLATAAKTAAVLELSRLNILQQASSQKVLEGDAPTEQELRAEYETQVSALPSTEYRARHILVATEGFAQNLITQLKGGAKFETLAKRESIDSSKENGGDLGWFTPDRMVPPFTQAVTALGKGEITQQPVQTQFGWHVIQLEDTRAVTPPAYDAVKERLVQVVQAKKFKAWSDELMKNAKIEKTPV